MEDWLLLCYSTPELLGLLTGDQGCLFDVVSAAKGATRDSSRDAFEGSLQGEARFNIDHSIKQSPIIAINQAIRG